MKCFNRRVKFGRVIICEIVQFEEEFLWISTEKLLSSTKRNSESFDRGNHRSMMSLPPASRSKINSHRSKISDQSWPGSESRKRSRKYPFLKEYSRVRVIYPFILISQEKKAQYLFDVVYVYVYIYIERERRIAESIQLAKFHRTFIDITITAIYPAAGLFLRDTRRRVRGFGG